MLTERLVVDFDAFGPHLVASLTQLDRLRRRGRWLDADGHLRLDARYPSADDAEASDTEFYARYLLTRGRNQLLAGPLPLTLTADAGERQLAAALRAALGTVAAALAAIPALRVWRDYAFPRAELAARLRDTGPLGGADLSSLAASVGRAGPPATRRRYATPGPRLRYTAIGPLLRTIAGGERQLVGLGYPVAVCHANAVIGDYARRDADGHGVLPSGAHLRLDDPWQGAGVWRASDPPGQHATVNPLTAYGLGWLESQLPQNPDTEPEPADDLDAGADLLSVTDSHLSWTVTLRLTHTLAGVAAVPDRVADELYAAGLLGAGLRLMLAHDGYELDQAETTQAVTFARVDRRVRLTGVSWPLEFFPGIVLTFTWQRGARLLTARSTLLETPVSIDGVDYEHRYDPAVLTRDTAPGCVRRGRAEHGPLSLRERVLRAVRRLGHLDEHGVAVLPREALPDLVYGPQAGEAGAAALSPVVIALLADAVLAAEPAVRVGGRLRWPADGDDGDVVTVLVWRPRPVAGPPRPWPAPDDAEPAGREETDGELGRFVHAHTVAPFLRRLPPGWHASEEARAEYRALLARFGRTGELPAGYTLVREHVRGV